MILLSFSAAELGPFSLSAPIAKNRFVAIGLGVFILQTAPIERGYAEAAPVDLPEITVSAAQTPLPTSQIGSSVTVITADQIEKEQRRTFSDLLQEVPGLNVVQSGGPGGQTSVFIRGTNSNHVKVLIDDIDVSDPSNPNRSFDFGQLSAADIARVEVLRGPQSGLYGADAIGGVISITTKKGNGPAKVTATLEALVGTGPPALLRAGPDALAQLISLHPDAPVQQGFDPVIAEAVDALADPIAALPSGVRMSVHPTPALTAIDVDLGSATAGRGDKARSQQEANRALVAPLCRQIRLRNLGGAILVDLAGMPARRRMALAPAFIRALADDPLQPRFMGFTALGLAEILRPRVHPPLHEVIAGPHAAGLAALRQLALEIAATPHRRPILRCLPAIAEALRRDSVALQALADRAGRPLMLVDVQSLPSPGWTLDDA